MTVPIFFAAASASAAVAYGPAWRANAGSDFVETVNDAPRATVFSSSASAGSCGASRTSPLGTTLGRASHALPARRKMARATRIRPLFVSLVLVVVVVSLDGERLLRDGGLGLVVRRHRRRVELLAALFLAFLFLFAAEAEEVALDVRALLRLGRTVMAGERDALRVLGALERLADRDARVLLIVAHDRDHVLVAGVDEVEEPAADLRLEEPEQLAVPCVHGDEAVPLAELGLGAWGVLRHDLRRRGV